MTWTIVGRIAIGWIAASLGLLAYALLRDWITACWRRSYAYRHRRCIAHTDFLLDVCAAQRRALGDRYTDDAIRAMEREWTS